MIKMVNITIEYMILTPVLIMLIFLLPLVANATMSNYSNSRQVLGLQNVASHLGSTLQQVYFSLNHSSVSDGTVSFGTGIPPFIEGYTYTVNTTSTTALSSGATIVNLSLKLSGSGVTTNTNVTLGPNVSWNNSYFWSNSAKATIVATKVSGEIQISISP
jgi:hypothetical protein